MRLARRPSASISPYALASRTAYILLVCTHTVLATEFGVAPLTVRNALAQLEQDGLISREHGRGTFVRDPYASS